jgi:hypothetical protein
MATVQISASLNLHSLSTWYGTVAVANSTEIEVVNNPLVGTYRGSFSYNAQGIVSGTLTSFTESLSGSPIISITNINIAAGTVQQLVESDQIGQLIETAFAGNDQFTVTPGTHVIDGYAGSNTLNEPLPYSQYSILNNGASLTLVSSVSNDTLYNIQEINFSNGSYNTQTGVFSSNGLINSLSFGQQLELIYLAYFNRAADSAGNAYWAGQNAQARNAGESAGTILNGIANAFAPQPETIALYPFLGTPNLHLNTPTGQSGLMAFIGSVYKNLFGHVPDTAGQAYWVGQLTTGSVGLGAAALAIANGATGADATTLQNKIITAFNLTTGSQSISASTIALTDPNVMTITGSNQLIDPTTEHHTIQFLPAAEADTLVLHSGGVDQITGFNADTDILDFSALLSAANINLNGNIAGLTNYVTITDRGSDALVNFAPTGQGSSSTIAVLQGLGSSVTNLETLIARGTIRIA